MTRYILKHFVRFVKYSGFGMVAFGFDLALLFILTERAYIPYQVSVPLAFLVATTMHYGAVRAMVFHDTARRIGHGYAYFLIIMTTNAILITALVTGLVELFNAQLYPARIVVGALFGFLSFFLNAKYNFKIT
jgi:putative flippase GtrA